MPITAEEIQQILATDEETGQVEFKIKAPRPAELAERICGMANRRSGGIILFGIENETRTVEGVARPHHTIDLIWMAIRLVKPAIRLLTPEPEIVPWDGKQLVILQIAPNDGELFQAGNVFWIRKGSHTVGMSKAEIDAHLQTYGSSRWETQLCPRATLADLDDTVLDRYLAYRLERSRGSLRYTARAELLTGLECVGPDPQTGELRPTHAGMLLFGREPQFHVPQSEITCIHYTDSLGVGRYQDRKILVGTLPELIDKAADFLSLHTHVSGEIRGFHREDRPEYPQEALREAVVNAVAHRDYSRLGESIRLFVYSDRVEIHSPGLLLPGITPQDLASLRVISRPRNPVLTMLLRDIPGYMERAGTGIRLMVHEMRRLGLPEPEFVEQHEFVVLFRNGTPPISDATRTLNPRQLRGLQIVQEHGSISTPEYVAATGVSERTALYDLREMVDRGILTTKGKTRSVRYYLP